MRRFTVLLGVSVLFGLQPFTRGGIEVTAAAECVDSTTAPVHLMEWEHPGDPWAIAVGDNGYVYVTDPVNDRICRYSLYGDGALCWGSTGTGPGEFIEPHHLSWNPVNDRLCVVDQGGIARVQMFGPSGNFLCSIQFDSLSTEPGKFAGPVGPIAVDPSSGNIWVYERHTLSGVTVDRLQEFDANCQFTGRVLNRFPDCYFPQSTVEDIAVDSTGSIYMLQMVGSAHSVSAIYRISPETGCVTHWGDSDGEGKLSFTSTIAIDRDGFINVLNTDAQGDRLMKYNRNGGFVSAFRLGPEFEFEGIAFLQGGAVPLLYVGHFGSPHKVEVYGLGIEPLNIINETWQMKHDPFQLRTDDLALLARCDSLRVMEGVAADGVSPLFLRWKVPGPGTVEWSLKDPDVDPLLGDPTEGLGSLSSLDLDGAIVDPDSLEVPAQQINGGYFAFALYTAPRDFERQSVLDDLTVGERPLRIKGRFKPQSSQDFKFAMSKTLRIVRPPIMLVHGWMSGRGTWGYKAFFADSRWRSHKVDYERDSGSSLSYHMQSQTIQNGIKSTRAGWGETIVQAQVDVIMHSMGGLLVRKWADSDDYRSTDNIGQGDFHKLLFLDTPHDGSRMAEDLGARVRDCSCVSTGRSSSLSRDGKTRRSYTRSRWTRRMLGYDV